MIDVNDYVLGQRITAHASIKTKCTHAPLPFIEGDLVSIMEDVGRYTEIGHVANDILIARNKSGSGKASIGTARTRGEVIEKLLMDGFFLKSRVKKGISPIISPAQKSIDLYHAVLQCGEAKILLSPELTAQWEADLTKIEQGLISSDEFMAKIRTFVALMTDDIIKAGKLSPTTSGEMVVQAYTRKSNCSETHPKHGAFCAKCKQGTLITMKVVKVQSKTFGMHYVRCSECDYFGEFLQL